MDVDYVDWPIFFRPFTIGPGFLGQLVDGDEVAGSPHFSWMHTIDSESTFGVATLFDCPNNHRTPPPWMNVFA